MHRLDLNFRGKKRKAEINVCCELFLTGRRCFFVLFCFFHCVSKPCEIIFCAVFFRYLSGAHSLNACFFTLAAVPTELILHLGYTHTIVCAFIICSLCKTCTVKTDCYSYATLRSVVHVHFLFQHKVRLILVFVQ